MKYSSTPRLINTIIFGLLVIGFGFMAIYYGCLVNPFLWITAGSPLGDVPTSGSVALYEMFGTVGFAGLILSGYGFAISLKSMLKSNDDELVQRSFLTYIGLGYMFVAAFLLNATWLYRLTTTNFGYNGVGFVIVIYILAAIVLLIATNVPLVKILGEEEDGRKTMILLSTTLFAVNCGLALAFFGPWIRNLAAGAFSNSGLVNVKYLTFFLVPLVASCLATLSSIGYGKSLKSGETKKSSAFFLEGAIAVDGIGMILAGIFSYLWREKKISLMASVGGAAAKNNNWLDFTVMSIIIGSLLVIAAIVFVVLTVKPPKAKLAGQSK